MKLRFLPGLPRVPNKEWYYCRESNPHNGVRLARLFRPRSCRCFGNIVAAFRACYQSHFSALRYPYESPISADMRRQNRRNRRDTNHVTVGYGVFRIAFSALDSIKGQLA